ncbi:P-loop containing nucleoside triphosphate hydrolase protein [Syncephalis pseudoplumigaleata]|uniref:P-loop containing nucleoside triphosphate hydrolase protein n=1 Tax=Syncephalis pseudoplumigaleata TaxID=1712513 RepID=A0A4P9Z2B0_9FUNG|nr:P-loop containing nucleoside triphosphate hydrolase protein [Syncephalis pseudoplumigaleata]|eukprot:RKP26102.1 P-loop containing nucleoside triphosphate hydrolase protein [Syncephalis pseudoplumigaleata]
MVGGAARQRGIHADAGWPGTVFTYGQTCSGKTFTMYGVPPKEPGIIPLAVQDIFQKVKEVGGARSDCEFLLKASFLEIYNEVIRDLLDPTRINLKIHETPNREVFVGNLSETPVYSADEVMELLRRGEGRCLAIGETNMNERSSRSHTIFRMVGSGVVARQVAVLTVASSNLVDLAGSERVGFTKAEGLRLKEGGHINKSLLALGSVIARLAEQSGDNRGHVPYRDSKLTRILQNSLGGTAKTSIICTITPAATFVDETISTLKFARRAMAIANKPTVNEVGARDVDALHV